MEVQALRKKPQAVHLAVNLLWASTFGIGLVKIILDDSHWRTSASATFRFSAVAIIFVAITFALLAFLIFKISKGKNWARITYLLFFVPGLFPFFLTTKEELSRFLLLGLISIAQVIIQVYAGYLLFSKAGSVWFRKVEPA